MLMKLTTGSVSTLTFLNFVIGSLSLAASLVSNVNSNSNNNNNNNNDNNNNDNNINIGNSNNNVNSQNQLMLLPMVGRKRSTKSSRKSRSIFWTRRHEICQAHQEGKSQNRRWCSIRKHHLHLIFQLFSQKSLNKFIKKYYLSYQTNEVWTFIFVFLSFLSLSHPGL